MKIRWMIVLRFNMQGKIFLSLLMASVMRLHFNMQEEDILEHINDKVSVMYTIVNL